jgi:hypothetical protein
VSLTRYALQVLTQAMYQVPGNELADRIAGLASAHVYNNMAEVVDLSDDEDGREE